MNGSCANFKFWQFSYVSFCNLFKHEFGGCFKLVSEPRFEGFEHDVVLELKPKARKNGCVRSETQT
ncbi:hypothetical protein Hanom_Chr11g00994271 [Helianthus anomalus]